MTYSPGGTIYFNVERVDRTLKVTRGLLGADFIEMGYRLRMKVWDLFLAVLHRFDEENTGKQVEGHLSERGRLAAEGIRIMMVDNYC